MKIGTHNSKLSKEATTIIFVDSFHFLRYRKKIFFKGIE